MDRAIVDLEAVAAYGWRGTEEAWLGDWLLRAADSFTGRANSALAIGDPGMPLVEAVQSVESWYRERGIRPMIAVPYPVGLPQVSEVDRYLATRDWTIRSGAATVMTASARRIQPPAGAADIEIIGEPDDEWLSMYHYRGQDLPPVARKLLMSAPWQAFARVRIAGSTAAIGRVAVHGGWAGLTAIEVDPGHRRRGLGRAITAALAAEGAEQGARDLYLQVETGNEGARALYHRMGFTDHHGYHYRVAPSRQPYKI